MTDETQLQRFVRESREAQGLPPKVTDKAALDEVARIITAD